MLQFEHVTKRYETGHEALADVNFSLDAGEFAFLTGPSGAGKSTLLKLIMAIELATRGKVVVNGQSLEKIARRKIPALRRQIGFVFQTFNLLPKASALHNVEIPLVYANIKKEKRLEMASNALISVGLEDRMHHRPNELSGGQRQTIAISRLLLQKVKLVILDEPMAALGVEEGRHVLKLIEKMKSNNISIIVISHNLEHVFKLADRIAIMKNGEMINILNTSTTNRESVVKLITFGQT